jgi:hypothetical protein
MMYELQNSVAQYARERFTNHVLWSLTLMGSFILLATRMWMPASLADSWILVRCLLGVLVLSLLAAAAAYAFLRTFLYDSMYRTALWLTPFEVVTPLFYDDHGNLMRADTKMYVWIPDWLKQRIDSERDTYRGISEQLIKRAPFGYPVDMATWVKEVLLVPYRYQRIVELGAIPSMRLLFSLKRKDQLFRGVRIWETYALPGIVGIIVTLVTYLALLPVA